MEHQLKTVNPYFEDIFYYRKTFEYRFNDRDFKEGDTLKLMEYDKEKDQFSGSYIIVYVPYVLKVQNNYVIMSIQIISKNYGKGKIKKEHTLSEKYERSFDEQ